MALRDLVVRVAVHGVLRVDGQVAAEPSVWIDHGHTAVHHRHPCMARSVVLIRMVSHTTTTTGTILHDFVASITPVSMPMVKHFLSSAGRVSLSLQY